LEDVGVRARTIASSRGRGPRENIIDKIRASAERPTAFIEFRVCRSVARCRRLQFSVLIVIEILAGQDTTTYKVFLKVSESGFS